MNLHEKKIKRISAWFHGKKSLPFKIVLMPTNRCNLKCSFCPNALPRTEGKFMIKDEITDRKWARVVRDGLRLGVREWSIIGGGEPLMRHDAVVSIVKNVKNFEEPTDCELITNGVLFKKEDIKKLVGLKIDRILFSIDAPDPETHDSLRGVKGAFRKAVKTIETFDLLKKKFGEKNPYLKINMVLNEKNYEKITKMVMFVKNMGVQELALHPMREYEKLQTKYIKLNDTQIKKMEKNVEKAKKASEKIGVRLNADMIKLKNDGGCLKPLENTKKCSCFEPLYSMLIDPEGNVGGCAPSGKGLEGLNIKEKNLEKIWFSEELNRLREKIIQGGKFEYCSKCGLLDMRASLKIDLLKIVGGKNAI